ncbi:hypothetical protein JCM6882_007396 [Rhodosporidiobolus microsporus]
MGQPARSEGDLEQRYKTLKGRKDAKEEPSPAAVTSPPWTLAEEGGLLAVYSLCKSATPPRSELPWTIYHSFFPKRRSGDLNLKLDQLLALLKKREDVDYALRLMGKKDEAVTIFKARFPSLISPTRPPLAPVNPNSLFSITLPPLHSAPPSSATVSRASAAPSKASRVVALKRKAPPPPPAPCTPQKKHKPASAAQENQPPTLPSDFDRATLLRLADARAIAPSPPSPSPTLRMSDSPFPPAPPSFSSLAAAVPHVVPPRGPQPPRSYFSLYVERFEAKVLAAELDEAKVAATAK